MSMCHIMKMRMTGCRSVAVSSRRIPMCYVMKVRIAACRIIGIYEDAEIEPIDTDHARGGGIAAAELARCTDERLWNSNEAHYLRIEQNTRDKKVRGL